jgi:glycosyltransferase involved in cell wall biosynthesis
VLLVGNFLSGTKGGRTVCEELALRLPQAGCSVLTTSAEPRRVARLLDMLTTIWHERRRYDVAQVDVYSGLAFVWAEAVCAALTLVRKPYILTLHGGNLPLYSQEHPARVRRLLRSAAAVTTPSRHLLDTLTAYRDDIQFIPNGVELQSYVARTPAPVAPRLIWVRAFHHLYNPVLAVQVLARLAPRVRDIRLVMIGPDKGDGSLQEAQQTAMSLGVADHVEFRPGVPKHEVANVLRASDIFLNTTHVDSAPVTVVEAMACGLCVVSTNVGGVPRLVDDGRDGLLVPPDDAEAMAAAVARLLDDSALATQLSKNGRRKAEQFDWPPIIHTWRSLFESTARRAA